MDEKKYRFDASRRERYLEALRKGARRGEAAETAGVTRANVSAYCQQHPEFREAISQAEVDACQILESVLWHNICLDNKNRRQFDAIRYWLSQRNPDRWAPKVPPALAPETPPENPADIADALKRLLKDNDEKI